MIISITVIIFLDRLSMKPKNLFKFTMDILRTLTTQSNVKISNLENLRKYNRFSPETIILVIFWLIFTNIITKCFTTLLLNSYFLQKIVPVVNNLEDVLEHHFSIAALNNTFDLLTKYNILNEKQVETLLERRNKYEEQLGHSFELNLGILDRNIFNDLVKGLAVFLLNGFQSEEFQSHYVKEKDRYKVLDKKYGSKFIAHLIDKNNSHLAEMVFA